MTKVPHALKFVTELDETHPTAQRFLQLSATEQVEMLEMMLKEMVAPKLQPTIDHINENGSWAILKVAE
jgi:DNA-binding protein Fis